MATIFQYGLHGEVDRELDENGNVLVEYTREPDGTLISEHRNGVSRQYHFDGDGNTLALTDDSGNVTDTFAYSAFGEVTERTGTTPTPYQYHGQHGLYLDSETGENLAQGRPLSPATGRFLSSNAPTLKPLVRLVQVPINGFLVGENNPNSGIGTGLGEVGRKVSKTFAPKMKIVKANVSCCIAAALDVNFLLPPFDDAPSGYIIQEIIIATQATDCDGNPVTVPRGNLQFWEAFSFDNIRFRNMRDPDDYFEWERDMRKTRGIRQVTGKLVGIIDYELPDDFRRGRVPEALELPSTYRQPPGWDDLPKAPHNVTLEWDCCCTNCCQMHTEPRWAVDASGIDCPTQIPIWKD